MSRLKQRKTHHPEIPKWRQMESLGCRGASYGGWVSLFYYILTVGSWDDIFGILGRKKDMYISVIRWEWRPLKLCSKLLLSSQQGCLPRPPSFLWRLSSHSWDHGEAANPDVFLYIPYPPPIDQPMRELCFTTSYQHCLPDWFRTKQGITLSQSEHSLGLLSQS